MTTIKKHISNYGSFRIVTGPKAEIRCLCFHGLGGNPNHFFRLYEELPNNVQLIMVGLDQLSGKTPHAMDIIKQLRQHIRGDIHCIIGHSAGSRFALAAQETFPNIPIITINPGLLSKIKQLKVFLCLRQLPFIGMKLKKFIDNKFFNNAYQDRRNSPFKQNEVKRLAETPYDQSRHWIIWAQQLPLHPPRHQYLQITGENDKIVPMEKQSKMIQAWKGEWIIKANSSHMLLIEEPEWLATQINKTLTLWSKQ
ncbi:MAG TPA: alpha/beta hydrolase [Gammaproteobacteria bacterium]|nr:alpha/beta hydrolase [Gammaproteobacteria bacterium]